MDYSKKDLRNSDNSLLRRIQRQTDKGNEIRESEYEKALSMPKPMKSFGMFGSIGFDGDSEIEQEDVLIAPVKKSTRLSLLRIRGGRQ